MKKLHLQHKFAQIPTANIQRSRFDRSHDYLTTFDSGYLIPFYCDEVLPGDTFSMKMQMLCRLTTPAVPFMSDLYLDTHFFYVPLRLIWDNFEKFMGAQENPGDSTDYLVPQVEINNAQIGSIFDYMGMPPLVQNKYMADSLWLRAYNLIWNEWFRDQNLQNSVDVPTDDGPDQMSDFKLLRRCKRHDYFTSALPWPQKGTAASVSLTGQAPLVIDPSGPTFNSKSSLNSAFSQQFPGVELGNRNPFGSTSPVGASASSDVQAFNDDLQNEMGSSYYLGYADLTSAGDFTINTLRQAFQIQKFLEKQARGGSRYIEVLANHFNVRSPDARLQRPEYLGGGSSRIHINAVPQTSSTDTNSPQGNLAAFGVVGDQYHGFTKSFVEHGVLIGLVSVRAPLAYQQGLNRMFMRRDIYDFYFPTFAHLGEQTITNGEIYMQGTDADNDVFGYQERYAEYRYKPDLVTGEMRSQAPQSLDVWHLAQDFEALPVLNDEFIQENPPVERVLAVQNRPQFLFNSHAVLKCVRPMPVYSVPGLVDHF